MGEYYTIKLSFPEKKVGENRQQEGSRKAAGRQQEGSRKAAGTKKIWTWRDRIGDRIGEEREKMAANRDHLLGATNNHLLGATNESFEVSGRQKKMGNGRQKEKRQKKIPRIN